MSTTVKFVYYTDVHIQDVNPPSRLGSYRDDILAKIRQVMNIGKKSKVDFTYCGGDLFNHKRPASTRHALVTQVIGVLDDSGVPNYGVPGNHDLQGDDISTLPEQPLGVLMEGGHMIQVKNGLLFKKGNLTVHLDSYDFEEEPDLVELAEKREAVKADVHTLGAHIFSSPKGGDLFGTKIFSYEELAVTGHDLYLLGHYHPDNGVEDRSYDKDRQTFINVGSLSRGDYGDENLTRKPKCALVTITKEDGNVTWSVEQILLDVRPAEEVFDLEAKEKIAKQKEETAEYVAEIERSSTATDGNASEEEELKAIVPTDKKIYNRTMYYINKAREDLAKVSAQ